MGMAYIALVESGYSGGQPLLFLLMQARWRGKTGVLAARMSLWKTSYRRNFFQMDSFNISVGIAFLAGFASFLSPCVLSLVPAYISYLGGCTAGGDHSRKNKWLTFSHGAVFVLGFSVVFILFNIIAAAIGLVLFDLRFWLAKIGGVVVIVLGLHMIGVYRIPFLEYDLRIHKQANRSLGYLSSFLVGIFFSAGWSPCVGPTLGLIMTFAVNTGNVLQGTVLGISYSAGLAIPFLIAALGIGWVMFILKKYTKVIRILEIVMGVLMVIIGVMLILGIFNLLATVVPIIDFGL
jgi:cytochrome c-type biogenesis protein